MVIIGLTCTRPMKMSYALQYVYNVYICFSHFFVVFFILSFSLSFCGRSQSVGTSGARGRALRFSYIGERPTWLAVLFSLEILARDDQMPETPSAIYLFVVLLFVWQARVVLLDMC